MVTTLIYIASGSVIAFLLYWTYYRFVKITKQNLQDYHKKIWWVMFTITIISLIALVLVYYLQ